MRRYRSFYALMGIALVLLQACGGGGEVQTPLAPATGQIVTQPPPTQAPTAEIIPAEFFSPIPFRSGLGFRGPWLELYFTDPANPLAKREIGGVDSLVGAAIVAAKQSVDVALKDLRVDIITNALLVLSRRGIPVRVVTETDNVTARSHFQVLRDAGIVVVEDQQAGQMNNTFIVIDHNQVWTGSMNYSVAGVFRENNSLIRIYSEELAADYSKEFDEMFANTQFGPFVVPDTPFPIVTIQGTQIEVLFSPDDLVAARLIQLIEQAQDSIYFLAYTFASEDLGNAIRAKAAQGITVGGVVEFNQSNPDQTNTYQLEQMNAFRQAGVDVRRDSTPESMNHKVMIIDGGIVVMGSYDFTERAETDNDENVLIIHNETIAQKFMEEFQRIQALAQP